MNIQGGENMAEKLSDLFLKARALLDEYSDDGEMLHEDEVKDMQLKAIPLADMVHKELYEYCRLDEEQEEPITFTDIDDTTEVNYKADQAIVYYIAARLAPFENKELVTFFESKYEELKRECQNKATPVTIEDVYSVGEVVDA